MELREEKSVLPAGNLKYFSMRINDYGRRSFTQEEPGVWKDRR